VKSRVIDVKARKTIGPLLKLARLHGAYRQWPTFRKANCWISSCENENDESGAGLTTGKEKFP